MTALRRLVPYLLLPLALVACALASSPWLRAYPSSVLQVPLFGAALLSVVVPLTVNGIGVRRLWLTGLIDLGMFVFFELLVTLREPGGFGDLYAGLVHGPARVLTYALPLISPRSLLVVPVALCWLCGAVVGECLARGWQSLLVYVTVLTTFGLSYAATARAITGAADGRRYDTLLAAALLVTLLLLRAAQAWTAQDDLAIRTQADGVLPLRTLGIGIALSVAVTAAAAATVQAQAFRGPPTVAARTPPLNSTTPLNPLSFVAGLRAADPRSAGTTVLRLTTDRPGSRYLTLASVDDYDGDSWTFDRTFRPSGGVVPPDPVVALRPTSAPVTQQYQVPRGSPLADSPWLTSEYRAQRVSGAPIDIDGGSGMAVLARTLQGGAAYTVRSAVADRTFAGLPSSAGFDAYSPTNQELPAAVTAPLQSLVRTLKTETQVDPGQVVPFLQAVAAQLRTRYALAGAAGKPPAPTRSASTSATASASARPAAPVLQHAGGTSFADVLASIRQFRSATPEQYATLMCLIARSVGAPARLATGFRVVAPGSPGGSSAASGSLPAGSYDVTTAEAWTWVEIPVAGVGWVVLDPSPATYAGRLSRQTGGTVPTPTPSAAPSGQALITHANAGNAVAPKSTVPHRHRTSAADVAVVGALVLAALVVVLLVLMLLRKWARVRRRRSGDPRRRLLGAWRESLDLLSESGLPDLSHLTSREISTVTQERFGGEPAAQAGYLGAAANAAIFSPTSWVSSADADAAWQAHRSLARAVRRQLGWPARIGSRLRFHRPPRTAPPPGPVSWAASRPGGKHTARRRQAQRRVRKR